MCHLKFLFVAKIFFLNIKLRNLTAVPSGGPVFLSIASQSSGTLLDHDLGMCSIQ